jgi:hypothetical protein
MINGVKFIFSALFLWIAFRVVDFHGITDIIFHANSQFILAAILLQLGSTLLAAYRWSLIMQAPEFNQTFLFYLVSYFKGAFFNQALPGSIGGDAVRILEFGGL